MMKKNPNDDVPGVTQRMSDPRPKAQAKIVLPPELAAGYPADGCATTKRSEWWGDHSTKAISVGLK